MGLLQGCTNQSGVEADAGEQPFQQWLQFQYREEQVDAVRRLFPQVDGDVAGGINAARYESRIDMCVGIGGSPEGITTACAIKALGGFMQGRLAPKDDEERARGEAAGLDCDQVYELDDLVRSDNTFFVATGVTDGELVDGVRKKGPIIRTESIVLRGRSGTIRRVIADHLVEKWLDEADR